MRTAASCACGPTSRCRCAGSITSRAPNIPAISAISARCSAPASRAANSSRPASNPSAAPTARPPTPRSSPSLWRARRCGASPAPVVRLGDAGLFAALLSALAPPPGWKRRLVKDFARSGSLGADLAALKQRPEAGGVSAHAGVLSALAGSDPEAAHALVTDLLSIAGISTVGGRTVSEIAERFPRTEGRPGRMPRACRRKRSTCWSAISLVEGDPDSAASALRTLAADAGLDLTPALDAFEQRTTFLAAQGVEVETLRFGQRLRPPARLLHRHGVRTARRWRPRRRWSAAGAMTGCVSPASAPPAPIPAVGFTVWPARHGCKDWRRAR